MITIGQLAAYAGVTIKAVRHYHKRGLLEEPPRDARGYRRSTAQHAIDLVKTKTLAEAGVPLAGIKALFVAQPDQFGAAMARSTATCRSGRGSSVAPASGSPGSAPVTACSFPQLS